MPFEPQNARLISRRITILAGIVALDVFFRGAGSGMESAGPSPEIISHYVFIFATLQALGILDLLRASLWTGSAAPADTKVAEAAETETKTAPAKKPERGLFWVFVRRVGALLAVVTILAALAGYSALAYELIRDLLGSAIIMGGFFLVRGLLRELIGFAMRSIFLQYRMGFRHVARRRFKFWLRGILDAAILLIAGYLLLALWIEPFDDISAWTPDIMAGFTVGNVTFSLVDILAALLIFVVALFVTRMFQRLLSEKVLPETAFDSGVQHSIAAGFGYLGVIIAAALGISALGIDLSNIPLGQPKLNSGGVQPFLSTWKASDSGTFEVRATSPSFDWRPRGRKPWRASSKNPTPPGPKRCWTKAATSGTPDCSSAPPRRFAPPIWPMRRRSSQARRRRWQRAARIWALPGWIRAFGLV